MRDLLSPLFLIGAGGDMFIAAGAAFFLAAVLVTAGLLIRARSAD